jgi:hypothetical protein
MGTAYAADTVTEAQGTSASANVENESVANPQEASTALQQQ